MDDTQLHKDRYHNKLQLILLKDNCIVGYYDIGYVILLSGIMY